MRKILISVLLLLVLTAMAATAAAAPLADVITPSDPNWEAYLEAHPDAFATASARSAMIPRTVMYPVTITKKLVGIAPEDLPDGTVFTYVLQDSNAVDQGLTFPQITKQNLIDGNGEYSVTAYSLMDDIFVKEHYAGAEIAGYYLEISATVHELYRPDWSAGFVYRDNGYVSPPMTLVHDDGTFNNGEVIFTNTYVKKPDIAPLPEVPGKYPITIMKKLEGVKPHQLPDGAVFRFRVFDSNGVDTGDVIEISKEELIAGNGTACKSVYTEHSGIFVGEQVSSKQFPIYGVGETAVILPNKFWAQWYSEPYGDKYIYSRPIDLADKSDKINNAFVCFVNTYSETGSEDPDAPTVPEEFDVTITKEIKGIDPEDLPDGTVFSFKFDSLDGKQNLGEVKFTKEDLMKGDRSKPIGKLPKGFEITENGSSIPGYNVTVDVKTVGVECVEPGNEEGSLGSFEIDTVPFEPDVPSNNPKARTLPVVEIIITNTYEPIDPSQQVPSDIDLPQTGDESDILLWLSLAMTSMAALALVSRKKREA